MLKFIMVGTGGFLGSILRFIVSGMVHQFLSEPLFPIGTLVVNIIGCLLIGLGSGLAEIRQIITPELRLFIFVGFFGGFTTFSTFGFELFSFAREGQFISTLMNLSLHIVLGVTAVWLGHSLARVM